MTIGDYQMLSRLGDESSEAYFARDLQTDRDVTIKLFPTGGPTGTAKFSPLPEHPNIAALLDFDCDGPRPYLVYEFIDGETLDAVLQSGSISIHRLMDVAVQAASGLSAAHSAGLVHGGLDASRVMLARDGRVKILDFGAFPTCSPQDDQLAFGRILAEALRHVSGSHVALDWIVERLLAEHPEDRYAATRDLYLDLRALRNHLPEAPAAASKPLSNARQHFRYRRPFLSVPLTLLACSVLVFYLLSRSELPKRSESSISSYPVWSADGKKILFVKPVAGVNQVFVEDVGSREPVQLTHSMRSALNPRWSPDGNSVAFQRGGKWWAGPPEPDQAKEVPGPPQGSF
jgi:hypothetical protein